MTEFLPVFVRFCHSIVDVLIILIASLMKVVNMSKPSLARTKVGPPLPLSSQPEVQQFHDLGYNLTTLSSFNGGCIACMEDLQTRGRSLLKKD